MCKTLRYEKGARRVVRHHCTRENIQHKHQLVVVTTAGATLNWPKDSQKLDLYINEEGMYELLFSSQQPKAKDFRKHCCNMIFPQIQQQLTNKMKEEHQQAIKERDNQMQALESTNEKNQQKNLKLNEEIDDLIKNRHVARRKYFDNVLCFIKKIARRTTHITLFNANIDCLKNIRDVLNFVTQTWRRLEGVMTQMLFIDGTYSRAK